MGTLEGVRPDGMIIVVLRSETGFTFKGFFHLSQVRQCPSPHQQAADVMQVDGADHGLQQRCKRTLVTEMCSSKRRPLPTE
jgi:hypothetical protein